MSTNIQFDTTAAADLKNALVAQKDALLAEIAKANDAAEIAAARRLLAYFAPAWAVAGYGYKAVECLHRLKDRRDLVAFDAQRAIATARGGRERAALTAKAKEIESVAL